MRIEITDHAKKRMQDYNISEDLVLETIRSPDNIVVTYGDRNIFQKKLNGYVLRLIVEENEGIKTVITLYKARSGRYEI